jgi:large subunit ribosomal protein L15
MKLHELRPAAGSKKERQRVGRGHGSGHGKSAGRGTKGQRARTGRDIAPYFEGGQLPLIRRVPRKRGFVNIFKKHFAEVNLDRLAGFAHGAEVNPATLAEAGIIKSSSELVVILGRGELKVPLTVKAHRFSASAKAKIEAAGGSVVELGAE